jgi:hypothetical protein
MTRLALALAAALAVAYLTVHPATVANIGEMMQ